jgi:hypothetical protein
MNRATLCFRLSFGTQAASFCTAPFPGSTAGTPWRSLRPSVFKQVNELVSMSHLSGSVTQMNKVQPCHSTRLAPATVYDLLVAFLHRIWYGMNQAVGHPAFVKLAARSWSSGRKGIAKRPPQCGGLRQGYVEVQDSRYSQSERAASSATTTQLVCSCRIEAGHSGVTGP